MNTYILKKKIYNISLSKSNSELNFFASKKSFLDRNLSSLKDVLIEISSIGKNEYGLSSNDLYQSLKHVDNNQIIVLDNGIMLINNLYEKIKKNCIIFLRLKNPIQYNENKSLDIIFTFIVPRNINTSSKLQILSKLSRILNKSNIRKKIRGADKAEDVLALLIPS